MKISRWFLTLEDNRCDIQDDDYVTGSWVIEKSCNVKLDI